MCRISGIENDKGARLVVFLITLTLTLSASAYDYPLSATAVREAYFFGRSTDRAKVAEFLGQYMRRFQLRAGGPNVYGIELRTPYEEVVLRSSENQTMGYSAQQAQIDYTAQPGLVKVRVFLSIGTINPRSSDLYSDGNGRILDRRESFWREFRFRVTQERVIEPKKLEGKPTYGRRGGGLSGAEIWLEFDVSELASRGTRVEVIAPDGRATVADFALDQLK